MALTVKRPEKRVEVCLDGSLVAEHERLQAELEEARKQKILDKRLNDPVRDLAQRVRDVEEKAKAESVTFLIRALPRKEWNAFEEAHPAREDNEVDQRYGVNTSTIFDAVLSHDLPEAASKDCPPSLAMARSSFQLTQSTPNHLPGSRVWFRNVTSSPCAASAAAR